MRASIRVPAFDIAAGKDIGLCDVFRGTNLQETDGRQAGRGYASCGKKMRGGNGFADWGSKGCSSAHKGRRPRCVSPARLTGWVPFYGVFLYLATTDLDGDKASKSLRRIEICLCPWTRLNCLSAASRAEYPILTLIGTHFQLLAAALLLELKKPRASVR